MIRTQLEDTTRKELQDLRRTSLPPKVRDRLEAVLLSDAGWSPPRIAGHLGWHPHTARAVLKGFQHRGPAAFFPPSRDRPPTPNIGSASPRPCDVCWARSAPGALASSVRPCTPRD